MMKPRALKINFKVTKRRLLIIEIWYNILVDGKVFAYDQVTVKMSVRWKQKINVVELQNYMSEKLSKSYSRKLKNVSIDSIVTKNAGVVWEVTGEI